ncbi:hypothetical protein ATCC90586_002535 [Pythium insidiosum]|nr:hypothetical protein ATCC90586_002535 [Pythium insidiosum]
MEEKRERILKIYHESKEVYNLKEIEKLGAKAGVVLQTVKDVNQALVDDALVDFDKIGSGNYFWSFPSKLSQQRKRKLSELQQRHAAARERLDNVNQSIETQKAMRSESDDRVTKLQRLAELQVTVKDLKAKIQHLADNDPEVLEKLVRSWVAQKRGCASSEVDKWLGIKDDFDYIE